MNTRETTLPYFWKFKRNYSKHSATQKLNKSIYFDIILLLYCRLKATKKT